VRKKFPAVKKILSCCEKNTSLLWKIYFPAVEKILSCREKIFSCCGKIFSCCGNRNFLP
jgi:hypothetical protein